MAVCPDCDDREITLNLYLEKGDGKCSVCHGEGYIVGVIVIECTNCEGSGQCPTCEGIGEV